MVSRWTFAMGCGKWWVPSSSLRSASRSHAKIISVQLLDCMKLVKLKALTANSASFNECVDMPPVLFLLVRLCSLSFARKDSCSSLSKLVKLTLLLNWMENWDHERKHWQPKARPPAHPPTHYTRSLPFVRVFRAVGEIFNCSPWFTSIIVESVSHGALSCQPNGVWDTEIW